MADKRVCMTIPQQVSCHKAVMQAVTAVVQECRESRVPSCQNVTREQCRLVPRERCALVTQEGARAQCRVNTRLVCEDRPRQKCGNKVGGGGPHLMFYHLITGPDFLQKDSQAEVHGCEARELRDAV